MKKLALTTTLAALGFLSLSSCALPKDPGASIGVSVTPDNAYIVPGKGVSCVAQAEAEASGETATADIDGERVTFSRFALQWRSGDRLNIAQIRARIFSPGITGANTSDGFEVVISDDEAAALLGRKNLNIDYANPYVADRTLTLDSMDSAKSANGYAPCGLQLGGLASVKTMTSYTARIKIEVIGFGTTCDTKNATTGACENGTQYPVRQSVTVRAQKY